ncbi:hypothetical protein VKT23_017174 [Stygiomarasmius scandens]
MGTDTSEKLQEAQKDFQEALRLEPKNDSARAELEKVQGLLKSKKSRRTQPLDVNSTSSIGPSVPRRRVPIKIIRPDGSVATDSSVADSNPSVPVSITSDKITVLPSPPASSPSTSSTSIPPLPQPTQPKTFQEAKRARDSRENQKPQTQSAQNGQVEQKGQTGQRIYAEAPGGGARTSPVDGRVGGGIFRVSGKNRIFESRENKSRIQEVDTNTASSVEGPLAAKENVKIGGSITSNAKQNLSNSNVTLFDFDKQWLQLVSSEERFEFLTTVSPSYLPTMFQTSLEPQLFTSICQTILDALRCSSDVEIVTVAAEYMRAFTKVPRIRTIVLFLSGEEKEMLRAILKRLEESGGEEIRSIVETCRVTMKV